MKKWRIVDNALNLRHVPWSGAVGIEEIDDTLVVPSLVCWFTRGWTEGDEINEKHPAYRVVELYNQAIEVGVYEQFEDKQG